MSDSDTSNKIQYQNANGDNLLDDKTRKQTTDTDFYFGMITNPIKVVQQTNKLESSDIEEVKRSESSMTSKKASSKSSSKSSHKSSVKYEQINMPNFSKTSQKPPMQKYHQQQPQEVKEDIIIEKPLSPQEIKMKKIDLLRKLSEIKTKGFQLSKEYDFNSSIEEMEYEYELLRSFIDKRNGCKIFKNSLLQVVSVVEFLNDKYDPFDFHLSGWSEHMNVEVDNWEDVLEEIYEKYKGSGRKMAPEIKLLYLIIASASAFHFTKAHASKLPGLESVLAANPGLLTKILNQKKNESSQFMTQQEINIEKQKEEIKKKENEAKQQSQQNYINQLQTQLKQKEEIITQHNIRAPDQVKDILNRIHHMQSNIKSNTETIEEVSSSNNDRLISESNIKKPGRKPVKKAGISIM
jgi:hypothetical protein